MHDDGWSRGLTGEQALRTFAPGPAAAIDRLVGAVPGEPTVVALCRRACATALELPALPPPAAAEPLPPAWEQLAALDPAEQAVVEFCEQFSIDVSRVDASTVRRAALAAGEGAELGRGGIVAATYVADFVPRVRAALDALFARTDAWSPAAEQSVPDLTPLGAELVREVHRLKGLDPVTSELVRLRGARAHDCRLCRSLRSREALVAAGDEATFASVERAAARDLPRHQEVALELVDALIWIPARLPEQLLTDVRAAFDARRAVELVLDVMKNAWNKTLVAVGQDAARVTDGYEVYQYHDDGSIEFGLDEPLVDVSTARDEPGATRSGPGSRTP